VRVAVPEESLAWLLGHARTGNDDHDALHAARVSRHLRELNSLHGGAVLAFLQTHGWSLRELAREMGTSKDSIARWADPPPPPPDDPDD
jgi:hypothetical protein